MLDNIDPPVPSKGKEKPSRVGPLGVLSGVEQLVPSKSGNPLRNQPSAGGEAPPLAMYTALSDVQKVAALEATVM
jgi:hypothetical protein